jgi:hypothetical protein
MASKQSYQLADQKGSVKGSVKNGAKLRQLCDDCGFG